MRCYLLIWKLNTVHDGCSISFNTYLGKNCTVKCTVGSRLMINGGTISDGTTIIADHGGYLSIDHSFVGFNSVIVARECVEIKRDSLIAEMVVIRDGDHRFSDAEVPISKQGFATAPIVIGPNAWLGAKTTVTAGCQVGEGAVVGANAVVTKDVPARTVVAGVPARVIKPTTSVKPGNNIKAEL